METYHFPRFLMAPLRKLATRKKIFAGSYPIILERSPDGYFVAECPLFDGCYSQGKTESEAMENIREAILLCL